jgi:hypothetical protein
MRTHYRSSLKFGAAALVAAIPSSALLWFLQDVCGFQGATWTWYVSGFVFYTALVFGNAYVEDDSILFSSKDRRSKLRILAVHCVCLLVLFAFIQIAVTIRPYLAPSLLFGRAKRTAWLELLFVALLMTVFFIEENWLSVKGNEPRRKRK